MRTEWFPLVNEEGETIGKATRKECHSGRKLLHPVIHLHIFNKDGDLYLQKRSMNKDIQPGKWDTAVGILIMEKAWKRPCAVRFVRNWALLILRLSSSNVIYSSLP